MKAILPLFVAAAIGCGAVQAEVIYTIPMGYVSISCPPNSDTIVGLPLRQAADFTGSLASAPDTTTPGSATLSLSGTPGLTANEFAATHYVKFKDSEPTAAGDGQWFTVTSNTVDSITVDLGPRPIDAVSGAQLEVLKLWTLGELFPPAECTTNAATTGNAVVATQFSFALATVLMLPDLESTGVNLAASSQFIVFNGAWRKLGESLEVSYDNTPMWPDVYFVLRNTSNVTAATTYTASGEVDPDSFVIPLVTDTVSQQDNFVAMPRAVDLALDELNLGNTSAFTTTAFTFDLKDQLMVFDNAQTTTNKSADAIYIYFNNAWRKLGESLTTDFGSDVIPAGAGILIRKAPTPSGDVLFWTNTPTY